MYQLFKMGKRLRPPIWILLSVFGAGAFTLGRVVERKGNVDVFNPVDTLQVEDTIRSEELVGVQLESVSNAASLEQRLKSVFSEENDFDRVLLWQAFLESLTAENVEVAYRNLQDVELEMGAEVQAMKPSFFKQWGQLAGRDAYEAALKLNRNSSAYILYSSFQGWANYDANEGWEEMVAAKASGLINEFGPKDVLDEIAKKQLGKAYGFVQELDYEYGGIRRLIEGAVESGQQEKLLNLFLQDEKMSNTDRCIEILLESLGKRDVDLAMEFVLNLSNTDMASTGMYHVLEGWAAREPKAAFAYGLDHRDNPEIFERIGLWAALALRHTSRENVDDLFSSITDPVLAEQIAGIVTEELTKLSPNAALELISRVEGSDEKSKLIEVAVWEWAGDDLSGAVDYYYSGRLDAATQGRVFRNFYQKGSREFSASELVSMLELVPSVEARVSAFEYIENQTMWEDDEEADSQYRSEVRVHILESSVFTEKEKKDVSGYWMNSEFKPGLFPVSIGPRR